MIILPNSTTARCGLLNNLFHDVNKENLYYIPENSHSSSHNGAIQKVTNCKTYADWPSSESDPYFTIKLFQVAIKPSSITLTRRRNVGYPKITVLEGFSHSEWNQICTSSFSFSSHREVSVKTCESNKFYTEFRFRQIKNRGNLKYIEFDSFDIFGELKYIDELNINTCKHCSQFTSIPLLSLMIIKS
jgi:hypothetical protein